MECVQNVEANFLNLSRTSLKDPDGFLYKRNRLRGERGYYRCHKYDKLKCNASAVTNGEILESCFGVHCHSPED